MMKPEQRHNYGQNYKCGQYRPADSPDHQTIDQKSSEQQGLCNNDVDVDRPDEVSLLALVDQPAILTFSVHPKR